MNKEIDEIKNEVPEKKKRHIPRKILIGFFSLWMLFELFFLFLATPLLRSQMQSFVNKESRGVYSIDFDNINLEITTASVKLLNFKLTADSALYQKYKDKNEVKTALYEISFSSLDFRRLHFWKLISQNKLTFKSFTVNNPEVHILALPNNNIKDTVKYDAVHSDLYSAISPYLKELKIKKVTINNGYFDFQIDKKQKKGKTVAEKITLDLYNFKLDSTAYITHNKLFYSDSLIFNIKNYSTILSDGIHIISADNTKISLADSTISIKNARIYPNVKKLKRNKSYYEISAPMIKLTGADIYKAWFNKEISINSLTFDSAKIDIISPKISKNKNETKQTKKYRIKRNDFDDIYSLFKGKLNIVTVKSFNFLNANFNLYRNTRKINPTLSIEELTLRLDNFMLDSVSKYRKNKILYSDNFTMNVENYKMLLAKNTHKLTAEHFVLSVSEQYISAINVRIVPNGRNKSDKIKMNIKIPIMQLNNIDIITAYNTGKLLVNELFMDKPSIDIHKFTKQIKKLQKADVIYDMVSDYLSSVKINKISLTQGKFTLKKLSDNKESSYFKGNLSLLLKDFILDEQTTKRSDRLFYASGFDINLTNYSMKSATDLHVFKLGQLHVSTFGSFLKIEKLEYQPKEYDNSIELLKKYQKSTLTYFFLDKLYLSNTDIKKAIFKKELNIDKIQISKPQIFIKKYVNLVKKVKNDTTKFEELFPTLSSKYKINLNDSLPKDSSSNIYKHALNKVLAGNLNVIKINKMNIDSGYVHLSTYDSLQNFKLSFENTFSANINKFQFFKDSANRSLPLIEGRATIIIDDYSLMLPDKIHKIKASKVILNNVDSSLTIINLRVFPKERIRTENEKRYYYMLQAPIMKINGVNTGLLIEKRILNAEKIIIPNPKIFVIKNPKIALKEKRKKRKNNKIKNILSDINIRNIKIEDGKFEYIEKRYNSEKKLAMADLNLNISSFRLDTTSKDIPFSYGLGNIDFTNFIYNMPDDMYHFSSDSINVSLDKNVITAHNLEYFYTKTQSVDSFLNLRNKSSMINFFAKKASVENLKFKDLFLDKKIKAKKVTVSKSEFEITKYKDKSKTKFILDNEILIKKILLKNMKSVDIDIVDVNDIDVSFSNLVDNKKSLYLKKMSARIDNFYVNKNSKVGTKQMFFSENIKVSLKNYMRTTKDSMYDFGAKEITVSTKKEKIVLRNIFLTPRYSRYAFAKVRGFKKNVMTINKGVARINGIDIRRLAENKDIDAKNISLNDFDFRIFQDRHLPDDWTKQPVEFWKLLARSKYYINIEKLEINNSDFIYEQNSKKSYKTGILNVNRISGTIENITNDSVVRKEVKDLRAKIFCFLQDSAHLRTSFRIPLDTLIDEYKFVGSVDTFDLQILNPFLENTAFISVNKGISNKILFHVNANSKYAEGTMKFFYDDLNIEFRDTSATSKKIRSLAASMFLRKSNSKRSITKKSGKMYSKADPKKGVITLWLNAILSGVYSTFGYKTKDVRRGIRIDKLIEKLKYAKGKEADKIRLEMEKELNSE